MLLQQEWAILCVSEVRKKPRHSFRWNLCCLAQLAACRMTQPIKAHHVSQSHSQPTLLPSSPYPYIIVPKQKYLAAQFHLSLFAVSSANGSPFFLNSLQSLPLIRGR